jgi:hypothetical protein
MYKKLIPLLLLAACSQADQKTQENTADTTTVISNDTIPDTRTKIKEEAVAGYKEKIADELNDWFFAVSVYETRRTFHYRVEIQAKEVHVTDSLDIPNFGIWPAVKIRKDKDDRSCILGFLDKKGEFKPYKRVSFINDQLRIKTIAHYYVGAYKTPVDQ